MPVYTYKGINKLGKNLKGSLQAESLRTARQLLKRDGIYLTSIAEKRTKAKTKTSISFGSPVKEADITILTRQLSTLVKANVPMLEALAALAEQVENVHLQGIMQDVRQAVTEGSSFADSLAKHTNVFDLMYISMVRAGEASGSLDMILLRLAEYTEAQHKLKSKVKSALTWPLLMGFFTFAVLIFIFTVIMPKIAKVFVETKQELPFLTEIILSISSFMVSYYLLVIASIVGAFLLFKVWSSTKAGKRSWHSIKLKIPVLGVVQRKLGISRFSKTLSTLLHGGVPIVSALDLCKDVVGNVIIEEAISKARENISEGQDIAPPLRDSKQFPPIVTHMIAIGEKTGELEKMLGHIAEAYDSEVENSIDTITSLLEPLMIVFLGGAVATIAAAVLMPIMNMNTSF